MPSRSQSRIRRDLNRLAELTAKRAAEQPALGAIDTAVQSATALVNSAWQAYQDAAVAADKERAERDDAVSKLLDWTRQWRPVVLLTVPGAEQNLRALPAGGTTPDDAVRIADDMARFIRENPGAASFRDAAMQALGTLVDDARKETSEAASARPREAAAREAYADACLSGNTVLVRGTEVVRAAFGATSPEYKQFIARGSSSDQDEEDRDSDTGET